MKPPPWHYCGWLLNVDFACDPDRAAAFVPAVTSAQAATLQPDKSDLSFTFKQMGVPVDGKFKKFEAQKTAIDLRQAHRGERVAPEQCQAIDLPLGAALCR